MDTSSPPSGANGSGRWLLYGANGYTGRLIAQEAVARGLSPVLAGRTADSIIPLAAELGCDYRIFSLDNPDDIAASLEGMSVVLHCAGPFADTAEPMVNACLQSGVHYMDIDGEIPVLESIFARHEQAKERGIALLPGSGFDVVPTDCLALMLKEQMPDATDLRLAMGGKVALSPGTFKVTLETIPRSGTIREDGALKTVPHAWKMETVAFDDTKRCTITIPWGDISTAWRSTGIPNIRVYAAFPRPTAVSMRMLRGVICSLLRLKRILEFFESLAAKTVRGPSAEARQSNIMHIRGDVWNASGEHRSIHMHTPEGYACTVDASLAVLSRVLDGNVRPGAWTPAQAFGSSFAAALSGVKIVSNGTD